MSFPLYDILVKDSPNVDLTIEEKKYIVSTIPLLNDEAHKNIFTIIRLHGLKNSSSKVFDIPYSGQKINNDIRFTISKLPNIVKQMIYRFVCIHVKTKEEDERTE